MLILVAEMFMMGRACESEFGTEAASKRIRRSFLTPTFRQTVYEMFSLVEDDVFRKMRVRLFCHMNREWVYRRVVALQRPPMRIDDYSNRLVETDTQLCESEID